MKNITVKLVHSPCGRKPNQRETVRGLGLSRIGGVRVLKDSAAIRGMINTVPHLVKIIDDKEA